MLGIFSSQSLTRVVVLCSLFILVCLGSMSAINHSLSNKSSSLGELALLLNSIQFNQAKIIDTRAELVGNKNQDTLERLNSYSEELESNIQEFNEYALVQNIDEVAFEPSFNQNMRAYEEYINQIDSLQKSLLDDEGKGLLESHRLAWFLLYRSSLTYNSESLSTSLLNTQYSIDNFINRPDTANLRSANSLISKTQESIGREYQYLYQAFLTYENVFQYITDIYSKIGINDESGLRRDIAGLEYALSSYVNERQANFDSYAASQLAQNQNLYWVANGTLLLSVILAVVYLIYKSASFENWMMASKTSAARLHRSKNQFLADVSNEIRTPLNGIIGMANFLSEDNLKTHQREQINIISNCSNKLLSLVNDVLDLSRIESGDFKVNPVVINTKQAVFDCVELYQQDALINATRFELEIDDSIPHQVQLDEFRLKQVLNAFLSDAVKDSSIETIVIRLKSEFVNDTSHINLLFEIENQRPELNNADSFSFQNLSQMKLSAGLSEFSINVCDAIINKMGGELSVDKRNEQVLNIRFNLQAKVIKQAIGATEREINNSIAVVIDSKKQKQAIIKECVEHGFKHIQGYDNLEEVRDHVNVLIYQPHENGKSIKQLKQFIDQHPNTRIIVSGERVNPSFRGVKQIAGCVTYPVLGQRLISLLEDKDEANPLIEREEIPSTSFDELNISGRVLIVEDDEVNAKVLSLYLSKLDCEFDVASNGLEAVNQIKRGNHYSIIIMDCMMPIMDGYQATAEIRKLERELRLTPTPIVALTANTLEQDLNKCLESGMDRYLLKPIDKNLLFETIEEFVS